MDAAAFDQEKKRLRRERDRRHYRVEDLRRAPCIALVVEAVVKPLENRYKRRKDDELVLVLDNGRELPLNDGNRHAAMLTWGPETLDWVRRPVAMRVDESPNGPRKRLVTDPDEVHDLFVAHLAELVAESDGGEGVFCETVTATLGIHVQTYREIPPTSYTAVLQLVIEGEIPDERLDAVFLEGA